MNANQLKKGDTFGVVKPSDLITQTRLQLIKNGVQELKKKGFNVVLSDKITETDKYGVSGGSAQTRAEELNSMFKDNSINAIWCAHGGNTVIELLELLDFERIKKNPKIFMGMSDIDVLHLAINKITGLITFNSCDLKIGRNCDFDREYSQEWFINRLMQHKKEILPNSDWKTVRDGKAEGKTIGCNVTSLLKLAGTKFFPDFNNSILLLEGWSTDIRKAIYQLTQLKLIGAFDKIKGVIVGYVYGFDKDPQHDKKGKRINYEDVVLDITQDYTFPILRINEFGHRTDNAFIPLGAKIKLDATNKKLEIIDNFLTN
ncbi:LD-carboxypeptidase [Patescibacteria group bacterium]|nr:LD-carboxypeptidase [Patescibacteria group bacterium]